MPAIKGIAGAIIMCLRQFLQPTIASNSVFIQVGAYICQTMWPDWSSYTAQRSTMFLRAFKEENLFKFWTRSSVKPQTIVSLQVRICLRHSRCISIEDPPSRLLLQPVTMQNIQSKRQFLMHADLESWLCCTTVLQLETCLTSCNLNRSVEKAAVKDCT